MLAATVRVFHPFPSPHHLAVGVLEGVAGRGVGDGLPVAHRRKNLRGENRVAFRLRFHHLEVTVLILRGVVFDAGARVRLRVFGVAVARVNRDGVRLYVAFPNSRRF